MNQPNQANSQWAWLLLRRRYRDPYDLMRARLTLLVSIFAIVSSLGVLLISAISPVSMTETLITQMVIGAFLFGVAPALVALIALYRQQLWLAIGITIVGMMIAASVALSAGVDSDFVILICIPVVYVALNVQWRGVIPALIFLTVAQIIALVLQAQGSIVSRSVAEIPLRELVLRTFYNIGIMLVVGLLAGTAAAELRTALSRATRLVTQLRATSEVAQRTSALVGFSDLLSQTVNFIRDRFGYYHVQLFTVDTEQRLATLAASTGEAGESLVKRGYGLAVGGQNVIGQTALVGEVLRIDGSNELWQNQQRRDELLPGAQSELVLPLVARDRVIGVLDIQSTRLDAFTSEEVDNLGLMAAHIAVAMSNAKTFEQQQSVLEENRRLFLEAETNLREIQTLNQRLTSEAWQGYLRERQTEVIGYTYSNNSVQVDTQWTPSLSTAVIQEQPVMSVDSRTRVVTVPIILRGRVIGAVEVETPAVAVQKDALEMLQSIAQRLALSIDNARLFEQAQELAQHQMGMNTISARMQGVGTVQELVRTAVTELAQFLGAEEAAIRLGFDTVPMLPVTAPLTISEPQTQLEPDKNGKRS